MFSVLVHSVLWSESGSGAAGTFFSSLKKTTASNVPNVGIDRMFANI